MSTSSAAQPANPVSSFFQSYEQNAAVGNIPALIAQFADTFMAAGPDGARCVRSADFALALPKRMQRSQSLGCHSTKLVSCIVTPLDARFVMAETKWQLSVSQAGQPSRKVFADSLFILDTAGEALRIVFYLAHQDLMASLRDLGTAPPKP